MNNSKMDKRFRHDAWRKNPFFSFLGQAYQMNAKWMLDMADTWQSVDPDVHQRVKFWTEQYIDALSPINFPFGSVYANEHAAVYIMNEDGCQNPAFVFLDIYADFIKTGHPYKITPIDVVYDTNNYFPFAPTAQPPLPPGIL